jgi:hypothetical protein
MNYDCLKSTSSMFTRILIWIVCFCKGWLDLMFSKIGHPSAPLKFRCIIWPYLIWCTTIGYPLWKHQIDCIKTGLYKIILCPQTEVIDEKNVSTHAVSFTQCTFSSGNRETKWSRICSRVFTSTVSTICIITLRVLSTTWSGINPKWYFHGGRLDNGSDWVDRQEWACINGTYSFIDRPWM